MRAVRLHQHGGPEVLGIEHVERPDPGPGELLVEVAAAGVNPVDTYFRDGSYRPVSVPFTPGVDFSGTVAELGPHVDAFQLGDRVFGTGIGNGSYQGSYAEFAVAPVEHTERLPDDVDFKTAGAAGVAAGTAWRALLGHAGLQPGERCLIHGGSGGVGHAAVQIADAVQAHVITTASESYHDDVRGFGADVVFAYDRADLADAVIAAADSGVDVVLDHRLDEYLQFDADVAALGCRVVVIGENAPDPAFSNDVIARQKDVSYQFMSLFNTPDLRGVLRGVAHLMKTSALRIEIDRSFRLREVSDAHQAVMEDSFLGKLVIEP